MNTKDLSLSVHKLSHGHHPQAGGRSSCSKMFFGRLAGCNSFSALCARMYLFLGCWRSCNCDDILHEVKCSFMDI